MDFSPEKIKRILVVRLDRIGDLVCTTPLFEALRHYFPKAKITLVTSQYTAPLFEEYPFIDRLIIYPKHKYLPSSARLQTFKGQIGVALKILSQKYDLAFGPKAHLQSKQALLVFLSKAPIRIGRAPRKKSRLWLTFCYNKVLSVQKKFQHEVDCNLELITPLGIDIKELKKFEPKLFISSQRERELLFELKKRNIQPKKYIVYHYQKRDTKRDWPWEYYLKTIKTLHKNFPNYQAIISGSLPIETSPKDQDLKIIFLKTKHLQHLAALIKNALLFISPDCGPAHIAAAFKVPQITIFPDYYDEGQLARWRPYSKKATILTPKKGHILVNWKEVLETALNVLSSMKIKN